MSSSSEPAEPTEASPLLPETAEAQSRNGGHVPAEDSGWTEDAIRTAILAGLFLTLYAFADMLKYVSTIRLVELGICREHYLKIDPGRIDDVGNIPEQLCKLPAIQQELAQFRGYLSSSDAILGLVLTLPYGLLVEKLGERLLAGINIIGYVLACAWILVVSFYWSTFPIWTAILSPLFRIIGGGSNVLLSVLYAIVAKHVPSSQRAVCFFIFMAAQLLSAVLSVFVTAAFFDHGLLLTPMMGNFPIAILCIITLLLIRNNKTDSEAVQSYEDVEDEDSSKTFFDSVKHSLGVLSQIRHNSSVIVLLATVPVAKASNSVAELLFQYIPKRFDLSLATASRVLSISTFECLLLLLVILPFVKSMAQSKYHVVSTKVDLYIVQYGFLFQGVGFLVMAASQTLVALMLGLLISCLGCSTKAALQSLLTDVVSREHIAVLYMVIAVGDGIGTAASAVLLNRALAIAIGWKDDRYLGLPFAIGGLCFMLATVASLFVGHSALKSKGRE